MDPAQLPAEAEFKGYEEVVVKDLLLRDRHVLFGISANAQHSIVLLHKESTSARWLTTGAASACSNYHPSKPLQL